MQVRGTPLRCVCSGCFFLNRSVCLPVFLHVYMQVFAHMLVCLSISGGCPVACIQMHMSAPVYLPLCLSFELSNTGGVGIAGTCQQASNPTSAHTHTYIYIYVYTHTYSVYIYVFMDLFVLFRFTSTFVFCLFTLLLCFVLFVLDLRICTCTCTCIC